MKHDLAPRPRKKRLDQRVHEEQLAESREQARRMIMAGEVFVDGNLTSKPGDRVTAAQSITVKSKPRFVSRGGDKLAKALSEFEVFPDGLVCADVGASTGGFTDCLLQGMAKRVYAIDVGYGQLSWRLRQDPRVVVMERTNVRYLDQLPETIDLVVIDVSFISLRLVLPVVIHWLTPYATIITLVKPQFEAGRELVGKGGVVRSPEIHSNVLEELISFARSKNLRVKGLTTSPLKGPSGNIEFLMSLEAKRGRAADQQLPVSDIVSLGHAQFSDGQ